MSRTGTPTAAWGQSTKTAPPESRMSTLSDRMSQCSKVSPALASLQPDSSSTRRARCRHDQSSRPVGGDGAGSESVPPVEHLGQAGGGRGDGGGGARSQIACICSSEPITASSSAGPWNGRSTAVHRLERQRDPVTVVVGVRAAGHRDGGWQGRRTPAASRRWNPGDSGFSTAPTALTKRSAPPENRRRAVAPGEKPSLQVFDPARNAPAESRHPGVDFLGDAGPGQVHSAAGGIGSLDIHPF